ncbi:MAG TPA: sigma-70 family RNA polymerase sigma factor [Actinomycetes bacterium]|nr:sigma-70 family RNA polymerase sigma factor [Actinomycetes bacterium]
MSDPTDEELLVRLRADPGAFVAFYDRHVDQVVRFAARRLRNPEAVADAVAAVFVELFETVDRYRPHRGTAIGWLYGVARNVVAEQQRQASRQARMVAKLSGRALIDTDAYADLEARIDAEAATRRLYQAMNTLSERERAVLELVALEQLTVSQAAAVLGIRAGTARVRLARARRRLRGLLDQKPPPANLAPPLPASSSLEAPK